MTFFKQKDSQIPASSGSDTKPFISPTVQQMAQRKEESENDTGRNESAVAENSFIKPHASKVQRKPNSGPDQGGNQVENTEAISDDKQQSEQGASAEANANVSTQKSTIDEGQEIPDEDAPTEYTFIFNDKERSISVNGTDVTMGEFSPDEVVAFRVDGTYEGNPPVGYKDQSMGFKLMLLDIMKPDPGDQFTVYFKQSDGRTPVHIIYTMGSMKSTAEAESSSSDGPQQGEGTQSMSEETGEESVGASPEAATGPYWTHDWRTDRFGNETVFIWEVGSRRRYSNGDKGYEYIRKMASLVPGDTGYDARFEPYKRRPQVGEGSSAKLNFWVKRTPGWDNPDHADNGTADFSDLAEFKDSPTNRKGT
ncbi:MAG: hypothetical protein AB8B56_17640, partial [Crocinitomicaceae bacterium]